MSTVAAGQVSAQQTCCGCVNELWHTADSTTEATCLAFTNDMQSMDLFLARMACSLSSDSTCLAFTNDMQYMDLFLARMACSLSSVDLFFARMACNPWTCFLQFDTGAGLYLWFCASTRPWVKISHPSRGGSSVGVSSIINDTPSGLVKEVTKDSDTVFKTQLWLLFSIKICIKNYICIFLWKDKYIDMNFTFLSSMV
jgi:hypothetical protein